MGARARLALPRRLAVQLRSEVRKLLGVPRRQQEGNHAGSPNSTGGTTAIGGLVATGGTPGGASATGGMFATGGLALTGGTKSTGGATTTPAGGAISTGGTKATGGSGGGLLTGGSNAIGGLTAAGGVVTGGAKATGGAAPTGGTKATGGAVATGGATGAAGATSLCPGATQVITVASNGGDFTTVQAAINSISSSNSKLIQVNVKAGTYQEQVTINKPFVCLVGDSATTTKITHTAGTDIVNGGTVLLTGNDFSAANIAFENSAAMAQVKPLL